MRRHSESRSILPLAIVALAAASFSTVANAEDFALHTFQRRQLTDVYYSEGANGGDIDGDGQMDIVYGPYWFEGPGFVKKHEIYPAKPQPREGYADNFFNWVHDFDGDGHADVLVVGFPGTPAYVYENPKPGHYDKLWEKHAIFPAVSNESPQFTNLVGDERPELVCTFAGAFGFATVDWDHPFEAWSFHRVSDQSAPERFGHGLGVGDVNGDGLPDILSASGWFEQPAESPESSPWPFHEVAFTNAYGGAEMYAYDVDGDGDNDIITSLAAHDFGLAWYEQDTNAAEPVFRQHLIMGDQPDQSRYGLVFSEPHSLALVDVDGDGLKDLVTGKTYYSHHKQSPMWDAGAVVYWFRLVRTDQGVDWIPYQADGEAGIGRQVSVLDVNGDKLPDIVVGGMKGSHVLIHGSDTVSEERWKASQPKLVSRPANGKKTTRGPRSVIDEATGRVARAIEGEELKVVHASAGQTVQQEMAGFKRDRWSGGKQLFWSGGKPGETLKLELPVSESGMYDVSAVFTMARDYAIVSLSLDGARLGEPLDLYNYPDVISTGMLKLGSRKLDAGEHELSIEITGKNASASGAYLVGLDYLSLSLTK
ncbi:MAG TPA: VCBS repeat-containing protein [Pirellulales bacterium]|nr:VCBS repeat-containing protein [Pirellulales bacterium]